MPRRLITSLLIGGVAGVVCCQYQGVNGDVNDLAWSLIAARDLVTGVDPYARVLPQGYVGYPLTAALIAAPLAWLPLPVAAGVFIALSVGLLCYGLLQDGEYWRLLVLVSLPAVQCVQVANWSLLLLAAAYLPWLYPLLATKPHAGAVVGLHCFSWQRVGLALAFVGLSVVIYPSWPMVWLGTLGAYAGRSALVVLPFGPLLALLVLRWRDERARYLLYCSVFPLRGFYDYVLLFFVARSRRELLVLVACSWLVYFLWFFGIGWLVVPLLYLPCLLMIFWRSKKQLITLHSRDSPQQHV